MKSRYFRLEEFLTSSTARQKSIENLPSWTVIENLEELALFLDGMRDKWGSGINISSGFRNEKLNRAVGGVSNSSHLTGNAADLQPSNGRFDEFVAFVKNYLRDKDFDECIIESNKRTRWIHFSLYNNKGEQRRKLFNITLR